MKIFLWIAMLGSGFCLYAQNLVQNGSFEDYTDCPDNENQVNRAIGWENWLLTPDYFNACSSSPWHSVPDNLGTIYNSYQPAYTGNAYAGFFSYFFIDGYPYIRDLIAQPLESSLIIGQRYYVSFKVSLAYNGWSVGGATNNIGAKFTTQSYSQYGTDSITSPLINNFAQIVENAIIEDSLNWTTISGSFLADSAYNYLVIGNFFDDAHTLKGTLEANAYYYLDDVCVSTDFALCGLANGINEINNSFEPITSFSCIHNHLYIALDERNLLNNAEYIIYQPSGLAIDRGPINHHNFNIDCSNFFAGAYFLKISIENQIVVKSFSLN